MNKIDFCSLRELRANNQIQNTLNKFKTIDEFMEWQLVKGYYKFNSGVDLCDYVVRNSPNIILDIVSSASNKPSKYDLTLIKYITNNLDHDVFYPKILEVYKNRKE